VRRQSAEKESKRGVMIDCKSIVYLYLTSDQSSVLSQGRVTGDP
jgi:hypothetical protein